MVNNSVNSSKLPASTEYLMLARLVWSKSNKWIMMLISHFSHQVQAFPKTHFLVWVTEHWRAYVRNSPELCPAEIKKWSSSGQLDGHLYLKTSNNFEIFWRVLSRTLGCNQEKLVVRPNLQTSILLKNTKQCRNNWC